MLISATTSYWCFFLFDKSFVYYLSLVTNSLHENWFQLNLHKRLDFESHNLTNCLESLTWYMCNVDVDQFIWKRRHWPWGNMKERNYNLEHSLLQSEPRAGSIISEWTQKCWYHLSTLCREDPCATAIGELIRTCKSIMATQQNIWVIPLDFAMLHAQI